MSVAVTIGLIAALVAVPLIIIMVIVRAAGGEERERQSQAFVERMARTRAGEKAATVQRWAEQAESQRQRRASWARQQRQAAARPAWKNELTSRQRTGKGYLYLVRNRSLGVYKVGVTSRPNGKDGRLAEHAENGWRRVVVHEFPSFLEA